MIRLDVGPGDDGCLSAIKILPCSSNMSISEYSGFGFELNTITPRDLKSLEGHKCPRVKTLTDILVT